MIGLPRWRVARYHRHMRVTDSLLTRLRLSADLTRREAAELVGVSPRTVAGWEQGRYRPHPVIDRAYRAALSDPHRTTAVRGERRIDYALIVRLRDAHPEMTLATIAAEA